MKKALSLLLALLLFSATGALAELNPDEQVELRFAWWGNQLRHDLTQAAIDKYVELHPNVTIVSEFYDWESYWDKLAAQGAGNALPDIIQMSTTYVSQYYEGGLLLNMEPYVQSGALDLSDIPENTLTMGRMGEDKELYAMNLGINALMALYDPAMVEAAGVELDPMQPYTFDDLQDWARIIYEETGILTNTYTGQPAYQARSQGVHMFQQDGSGELGFEDASLMAYFSEQNLKGKQAGYSPSPDLQAERGDALEEGFFIQGEMWNTFTWSNIASAHLEAAEEGRELKAMLYPLVPGKEDQKPLWYSTSQQICVASNTASPDWAMDFVDYMINSVEANEILLAERGIPVNTKVNEAIQPLLTEGSRMAAEYVANIDDFTSEVDVVDPPWAGEIYKLLTDYNERVLYEQMTAEDALAEWMVEANKIIENQKVQ